jgi:ethanolamine utilization protein EutN
MLLGRVIGTVVPSILVDELSATPLLWVQPLDREGQPEGEPLVCADGTRMAGPGQVIYWVASREAALTLDPWFVPVDDAIVGLVDEVMLYPPDDPSKDDRR